MHELGCVALVLVGIIEKGIAHANQSGRVVRRLKRIAELLVPHPVGRLFSLNNVIGKQVVNNRNVVNDV